MKTKLKKVVFYMLAFALGGCVPSLHPLFDNNEIVFDANLVGKWGEPNSDTYWEFKKANKDTKKYNIIYTDEKGAGRFDGMLGKIGSNTFLDIYPQDMNMPGNDFYKAHLLGVHTFLEIEISEKGLELELMNPENVEKLLKSNPNIIKYEKVDDRIVFTAPTKKLQNFILKYGDDDKLELFGNDNDDKLMQRVK